MEKYEQIMDVCMEQAEAAGMSLDYDPAVMVEDISAMSTGEWVKTRRSGIGGSDAGTVMKVNPHKSRTELAMDKLGKLPQKKVDARTQFIFDYGHQMEACLGNYFSAFTGFRVYVDNRMFYHPFYPWMHANCDGFAVDADGYKCLLEFKTANPEMKSMWKSGVLGQDAVLYRPEYEYQVRHYMSILNIFRAYIVIGFDNNSDNICIIRVDRDIEKEISLINAEADFWKNYVQKGQIPYETTYSDGSYKGMKPKKTPESPYKLEINKKFKSNITELLQLAEKKTQLNAQIKKIDERSNALRLPIELEMADYIEGYMDDEENKVKYTLTYKPSIRESVSAENLKRMKISDPDLYEQYGSATESRTLRVSARALKR